LLTAAPMAAPLAVPMVCALVAQPARPTSDAASAMAMLDFICSLLGKIENNLRSI
jgi:hypothetical protein